MLPLADETFGLESETPDELNASKEFSNGYTNQVDLAVQRIAKYSHLRLGLGDGTILPTDFVKLSSEVRVSHEVTKFALLLSSCGTVMGKKN